jgi:hypothetical protein
MDNPLQRVKGSLSVTVQDNNITAYGCIQETRYRGKSDQQMHANC